MLNVITSTFATIKSVCYYLLVVSYKTGQAIIHILNLLSEVLITFYKNSAVLFRVIFEDFWVFLVDLHQRIQFATNGIYNLVSSWTESIVFIICGINNVVLGLFLEIFAVFGAIPDFFHSIYNAIALLVILLKKFVILLGGGIWFAITLVPLFLIYVFTLVASYASQLVREAIDITHKCYQDVTNALYGLYCFVTDVPLESIAGLLVGTCILYVLARFHLLLYRAAIRPIAADTSRLWTGLCGLFAFAKHDAPDEGLTEDNFCIICREHYKCVLLLPCKHLCLCQTCYASLRNYNRKCPICRKNIQRTMKVYM